MFIRAVECQIANQGLYIFALLCVEIFPENLHPSLNQSDAKLTGIIILSSAFCRSLGSFLGFSLSSYWLLKDIFGFSFTTLDQKRSITSVANFTCIYILTLQTEKLKFKGGF